MQAPQAASIDTTDGTNLVTNNRIQVLILYLASLTTLVEKVEVVMPKQNLLIVKSHLAIGDNGGLVPVFSLVYGQKRLVKN